MGSKEPVAHTRLTGKEANKSLYFAENCIRLAQLCNAESYSFETPIRYCSVACMNNRGGWFTNCLGFAKGFRIPENAAFSHKRIPVLRRRVAADHRD
jgi:hypothetical protein